ncbi:hypothetical protein BRADI_2g60463v3, partial [Brachypodium distachyon]
HKRARIELNLDDIVGDPGLRKPIEDFNPDIRDDARRSYLSKGPCRPIGHNSERKMQSGQMRGFIESWFEKFDWLEYSVDKEAAFCFYCYLFKPPRIGKFGNDTFTKTGFVNWRNGLETFNAHVGKVDSTHNKARKHALDFQNQRQSLSHVWSEKGTELDHKYKARMLIILCIVRFLLLQSLAFREHNESSTSRNRGNFLELFGCVLGDNAPRNCQMTSHKIQKDLVRACVDKTRSAIMSELGERLFAVLVDESRDKLIKEQMAVILRYVNGHGHVIERFLGVKHVSDTTSASLKIALDAMFAKHCLSISRLLVPWAFYIQCFARQLQLVVVSVAKCCSSVEDFFNYTTLIVNTVSASCKRSDQLLQDHHDKIVGQLERGEVFPGRGKNQETSLARPGDTRWGTHHRTLARLQLMWTSVLEVLENIFEDGDSEQRTKASGLIERMENFEFVLVLHLMIRVLGKTQELSQCLQRKNQNIVRAVGLIGSVLKNMNDMQENGWEELFQEVTTFCGQRNIVVPNMEDTIPLRGRSRGRGAKLVSYYHHFHHGIFNVVLDKILVELNNRFAERSTQLLRCIACLDPKNSFANFDQEKLLELAMIYASDFSEYDCVVLKTQLETFIVDVRSDEDFSSCNDLGNLALKMVQSDRHTCYPLVYRLIELALILPVATATVERAFSAMNIIKTELRNKMNDEWMDDSMVCYTEREMFSIVDDGVILKTFQGHKIAKGIYPKSSTELSGMFCIYAFNLITACCHSHLKLVFI